MKKNMLCLLTLMAVLLSFGTAHALPSASTAFVSGVVNTLSDDDGEVLVDNVGGLSASPLTGITGPTLDIGDYLVGAIGITSFPTSGTDASSVNQLTAIFAVEVTANTPVLPDSLAFPNITGGIPVTTGATASFSFAPVTLGFNAGVDAAFTSLFTDLGIAGFTDLDGGALPASTVAMVFEGPPNDFLRSNPGDVDGDGTPNTVDDAALAAANGTPRMVVGVEAGDFWNTAYGPIWILDALLEASLSPTGVAQVGAFSASLTILSADFPGGWEFDDALTITNGAFSGDVATLQGDVPWAVTSNADFQFTPTQVPEPGTLSLLGVGLLGTWFYSRRRRS